MFAAAALLVLYMKLTALSNRPHRRRLPRLRVPSTPGSPAAAARGPMSTGWLRSSARGGRPRSAPSDAATEAAFASAATRLALEFKFGVVLALVMLPTFLWALVTWPSRAASASAAERAATAAIVVCYPAVFVAYAACPRPKLLHAWIWLHAASVCGVTVLLFVDYGRQLPRGLSPAEKAGRFYWDIHLLLTCLNWPFAQLTLRQAAAPDVARQVAYAACALRAGVTLLPVALNVLLSTAFTAVVLTVAVEPAESALTLLAGISTSPPWARRLVRRADALGLLARRRLFADAAVLMDSQSSLILAVFNATLPYRMLLVTPPSRRIALPDAVAALGSQLLVVLAASAGAFVLLIFLRSFVLTHFLQSRSITLRLLPRRRPRSGAPPRRGARRRSRCCATASPQPPQRTASSARASTRLRRCFLTPSASPSPPSRPSRPPRRRGASTAAKATAAAGGEGRRRLARQPLPRAPRSHRQPPRSISLAWRPPAMTCTGRPSRRLSR